MVDAVHIVRSFHVDGEAVAAEPWGRGHIHDSFAVTLRGGRRLLAQRLNERVFSDLGALAENVRRVTDHLRERARVRGASDLARRALTPIPTRAGADLHRDAEGRAWRVYEFVEGASRIPVAGSPRRAFEAARAFGQFLRDLDDLPGPRLRETIPGFHDTPARLDALREAVRADAAGRVAGAEAEIDFALERAEDARALIDAHEAGEVPERVVHNDAKVDNLLFDDATGAAICVVDLDTVMPGLSLHDFGDLVRSGAGPVREDEREPDEVDVRPDLFAALADGYRAGAGDLLTAAEVDLLPVAGCVLTFTIGIRFLTDHLEGDPYFGVHRPGQNLDRARTQLALVRALEARRDELHRLVRGGS